MQGLPALSNGHLQGMQEISATQLHNFSKNSVRSVIDTLQPLMRLQNKLVHNCCQGTYELLFVVRQYQSLVNVDRITILAKWPLFLECLHLKIPAPMDLYA